MYVCVSVCACVRACVCVSVCVCMFVNGIDIIYIIHTAKINETSTFGPADDDITFDYDGDDYGDDNDEEDIVDAVRNFYLLFTYQ